jgi:Flp pilus assembly protein TadD
LLRLGRLAGAVSDFDRVLNWQPSDREALHNRGLAHRQLGDFAAAISDFNTLLAYYPGYAIAYQERGATWLRLARVDNAQADFQAVLGLPSASPELRAAARQQLDSLRRRAGGR